MRVSFDSNAWEAVFALDDSGSAPIRAALAAGRIAGFICDAAFRIEAITKRNRPVYFAQPHMDSRLDGITLRGGGRFGIAMSFGPDNAKHPGLPDVQAAKLRRALAAGVKLISGLSWMGLPGPPETSDRSHFVYEDEVAVRQRKQRQLDIFAAIEARGVGRALFDVADGWTDRFRTAAEEKQLTAACAEWADGELVAAHYGYCNDVICTNDQARKAGRSVFDAANRAWLATSYGVTCLTLSELTSRIAP